MLVSALLLLQIGSSQSSPPVPADGRPPAASPAPVAATVPVSRGEEGRDVFLGRSGSVRVRAPRVEGQQASVDGVLDEPAWRTASVLTGFTSYNPVDGRPAQDSTEVLVWYAPDAIHVGIRAWAPAGTVRATLAERDRIANDDWVALHLDTFNDRRRAFVFAVNALGVQADGMRSEQSAGPGQSRAGLGAVDLTQDYIWQSKGRLLDDGYVVELRIPFKSIRYQAAGEQRWGLQVVRQTQRTGYQDTWAPTSRANQAFSAQAGYLLGMRGMRRGLVLDLTPTVVGLVNGRRDDAGAMRYGAREQLGGDLRWGVTSNFTLNATANPDFSQVEPDVGQIPGDVRFQLFFPELRPFFVEGSEQFDAPNRLVYTRQIQQPVAAAKLTGKVPNTDIGLLMAMDAQRASSDGTTNPFFTIFRLRRDLGEQSTAGIVYTDRTEGSRFNRVGGFDTRLQFNRVYNVELRVVGSVTRDTGITRGGGILEASTGRTGRSWGYRFALQGISPDFETRSGFVNRTDFVRAQVFQRWTRFGRKGGWWDQQQQFLQTSAIWTYDDFERRGAPLETRVAVDNSFTIRGGWRATVTPEWQTIAFDPRRYTDYRVVRGGDTVAFAPSSRQSFIGVLANLATPQWRRLGATLDLGLGRDAEFFETSTVNRASIDLGVDLRPTQQLRIGTLLRYQRFSRVRDGSLFSEQLVPRLRLEYQLSRALFVRFIGQVEARDRDALRDPATDTPILRPDDAGAFVAVGERRSLRGRADWLVSYLPSPGTVIFVGYGSALDAAPTYRPGEFRREGDGFFIKLSYLWRAGVRGVATGR
jgi:hypothetical protein